MNTKGYMWILIATTIVITTTIILYENNTQINTSNFSDIISKDAAKLSMYEIALNKVIWDCNWKKSDEEINAYITTASQNILNQQLEGICTQTGIILNKTTSPKKVTITLNCQRTINTNEKYQLEKEIIIKSKPGFLDKTLLLWLRMNGNTQDNSGNLNNPAYINATPARGIEDIENTGYSFNGTDNNITIPTNFNLTTKAWTMSTWAYINSYPKKGALIMIGANGYDGYGIGFGNGVFQTEGNDFLVLFEKINWYNKSNGNPGTGWRHIAVTYNGTTTLKIYYDGVLNKTITTASPISPTLNQTKIGGYYDSFNPTQRYFNGIMDEVMIFGEELNATDINAIYNYTKPI